MSRVGCLTLAVLGCKLKLDLIIFSLFKIQIHKKSQTQINV